MMATLDILRKDLLVEWRARAFAFALACFALNLLLLFSFAVGPDTATLRQHSGAYLWMAVVLTSTLLLNRSFQVEAESGAEETVRLAPVMPPAVFYGKSVANTVMLVLLCAVGLPASVALFDVTQLSLPLTLVASVVLGCAGLAAPGTLYAALTVRLAGNQVLLPLLLFPLVVPVVLATVKSTSLALLGDPMSQSSSWLVLLVCFDLIYWSLCGVLFGRVVES